MDKYHMVQSSLCTNELCSALLGKVYDRLVLGGFFPSSLEIIQPVLELCKHAVLSHCSDKASQFFIEFSITSVQVFHNTTRSSEVHKHHNLINGPNQFGLYETRVPLWTFLWIIDPRQLVLRPAACCFSRSRDLLLLHIPVITKVIPDLKLLF